jgi:hypothetical protein
MGKSVNGVLTKDLTFNLHHQEIFHCPLQEFLKVWYVHNIAMLGKHVVLLFL